MYIYYIGDILNNEQFSKQKKKVIFSQKNKYLEIKVKNNLFFKVRLISRSKETCRKKTKEILKKFSPYSNFILPN